MGEVNPTFVIEVEMILSERQRSQLETQMDVARQVQNSVLEIMDKRLTQLRRHRSVRHLLSVLRATKSKSDKQAKQAYAHAAKELNAFVKKAGLSEYDAHDLVVPMGNQFQGVVNSAILQKAGSRAAEAIQKKLYGKAKNVHFMQKGVFPSLEGKSNTTGFRFRNGNLLTPKNVGPLSLLWKDDLYHDECRTDLACEKVYINNGKEEKTRVKFTRVIRKVIRGRVRFFCQLVCGGFPPVKRNKDGSFRHKRGTGRMGLDIGMSTLAVSSSSLVRLYELAPGVKNNAAKERRIQRKMDRSKRATNPSFFNEDGTIKPGRHNWDWSNRYLQLTRIQRKQATRRLQQHQELANQLCSYADTFFVEAMEFARLAKRSNKDEVNDAGRVISKKQFGKSVGHRAPALFIETLAYATKRLGSTLQKMNTITIAASQYDHTNETRKKVPLSQRSKTLSDGTAVLRDLYSAFLLEQTEPCLSKVNNADCQHHFERFKQQQAQEIKRLQTNQIHMPNSGIFIQ